MLWQASKAPQRIVKAVAVENIRQRKKLLHICACAAL
jgi:hypothetical protein